MNSKITERHSRFSEFLQDKWDPDVLQELTLDTARTCEIDQLVPHLLSKRPSQFSFYECQRMIANCDIALRKLHKAGFYKGSFNIFVEDHSRPDVAEAVRISLEDLEILHNHSSSSHIPKGMDKESHRIWHLIKKLQHHYYDNDELYPRAHLKSGKWLSHLNFLCLALSVGLVSFTKSHVGRFDMDVFTKPISKIRIGQGLRFLPRELSCLSELIKGPVWVLGKDHLSHVQKTGGMKVSMTVYDFVELWEPILMVGGTPEQAPAIRSEGGFIVPSGQNQKRDLDSPKTLRPGEIECHWIKDPLDQRLDPKVLAQSNIQLNRNSRILFGTASSQLCSVCEAQGYDGGLIKDREERHREVDEPYLKRMARAFLGKKQGILRK